MIEVRCGAGDLFAAEVNLAVLLMPEGSTLSGQCQELDRRLEGGLALATARTEFTGKWLTHWSSLTLGRIQAREVLVVGIGKPEEFNASRLRQAMGKVMQLVRKRVESTVAVDLSELAGKYGTQAATEGLYLGAWKYLGYHQEPEPKTPDTVVQLIVGSAEVNAAREGVGLGRSVAQAQNLVRELGWMPSSHLYPQKLAEAAVEHAERAGLSVEVIDEQGLAKLGMGALLGVGQGSAFPPRMVVIRYDGGGSKTLALVGKGITFDSGGISLKPPAAMEEMKYDMLGAGAVLGAMCAIAAEKPRLNVIGIMAIAQNMPSGSAYKPGDVVTAFNGKTIEVTNTDAEGRVALADAVSYAVDLGVDYIVEASTLTGAALICLGHEASALIATDDGLAEQVLTASAEAGERVWRLPIYPEYRELYESDVADIKNAPGRDAGTITGGMIISEFAGSVPFCHLDIAGTAWTDEGPLNLKAGATGVMVRTFTQLAGNLAD